ncbi:hypothetical protein SCALM49S_03452 [Streptomyces californicus]
MFTNTVFGFIVAYTYTALWDARPRLGGYDASEALTYVWLGQALLMACAMMGGGFEDELVERDPHGGTSPSICTGPSTSSCGGWRATLGRAAFHLLGRGVVPMVLGALAFDLALPVRRGPGPAFLGSVFLGVVVSFAVRYLVALSAFWLMDGVGAMRIVSLAGLFFSGMLLPLNLFPGLLGEVARALPWSSLLQVPADVFLGKHTGWGLVEAYAFQGGWAVVLLVAGRRADGGDQEGGGAGWLSDVARADGPGTGTAAMDDGSLAGLHEVGESERMLVVDLERELPPIRLESEGADGPAARAGRQGGGAAPVAGFPRRGVGGSAGGADRRGVSAGRSVGAGAGHRGRDREDVRVRALRGVARHGRGGAGRFRVGPPGGGSGRAWPVPGGSAAGTRRFRVWRGWLGVARGGLRAGNSGPGTGVFNRLRV